MVMHAGLTDRLLDLRRLIIAREGNFVAQKAMKACPPVLDLKPGGLGHHWLKQPESFGNAESGSTFKWGDP